MIPKGGTVVAGSSFPGLRHGDIVKREITNIKIKLHVNDIEIISTSDDRYGDGDPDINFSRHDCGINADFDCSRYTGTDAI